MPVPPARADSVETAIALSGGDEPSSLGHVLEALRRAGRDRLGQK